MPLAKRSRVDSTEDWQQHRLLVQFAAQERYGLLRPIVWFGQLAAERAQQTGVAASTLRRKALRLSVRARQQRRRGAAQQLSLDLLKYQDAGAP